MKELKDIDKAEFESVMWFLSRAIDELSPAVEHGSFFLDFYVQEVEKAMDDLEELVGFDLRRSEPRVYTVEQFLANWDGETHCCMRVKVQIKDGSYQTFSADLVVPKDFSGSDPLDYWHDELQVIVEKQANKVGFPLNRLYFPA